MQQVPQPRSGNVRAIQEDPLRAIQRIEKELNDLFLEREEIIRALLCSLITSENAVLLGPPSTGKSRLSRAVCSAVTGGRFFRAQLTRFSTPEELLGFFSTHAMRDEDAFRRKSAGYLPEATIAFVDEVFKPSSALLNVLLPVLEEKEVFDEGRMKPIPLKMFVGASNEMPRDRTELDALWDRFTVRIMVPPISEGALAKLQLEACKPRSARVADNAASATPTTISEEALRTLSEQVEEMDATAIAPALAEVRARLEDQSIPASARRHLKLVRLVCAQALLSGRSEPTPEDLAVLTHVLWNDPGQARAVRREVMRVANPSLNTAIDLMDEAAEVHAKAMGAPEDEKTSAGTDANTSLKKIQNRLLDLREEAQTAGRAPEKIDAYLKRVGEMNKEVMADCLGLDF